MKVVTEDGEFTSEDHYVAIHLTDDLKRDVEMGALMVNMLYPVHAGYEKEGRKGTNLENDTQSLVKLQRQDIETIRQMPDGYCFYATFPEERETDEISELNKQFKEEVHG
jgi:hypothetical protein